MPPPFFATLMRNRHLSVGNTQEPEKGKDKGKEKVTPHSNLRTQIHTIVPTPVPRPRHTNTRRLSLSGSSKSQAQSEAGCLISLKDYEHLGPQTGPDGDLVTSRALSSAIG